MTVQTVQTVQLYTCTVTVSRFVKNVLFPLTNTKMKNKINMKNYKLLNLNDYDDDDDAYYPLNRCQWLVAN